jgi:C-terminal processing protease CtpA/Prc
MRFLFFILFFVSQSHCFSPTSSFERDRYKQLGLVWGLLKYHHPEISKGKYSWDNEFILLCDKVATVKNQQEMNGLLVDFLAKYPTKNVRVRAANSGKLFTKNVDYGWIDEAVFGAQLTTLLRGISENANITNYYASTDNLTKMLSFNNEKGFKDFNHAITSHRLLLLFNFWNAIHYWNVNKYLMAEKWLDCLDAMTTEFLNCNTHFEFEMAKSKLISKLNDSHSFYLSKQITDKLFKFKPPFFVKNINDSLLVQYISNKALAEKNGIELGDVICKINKEDIGTVNNKRLQPLLSASNPTFLKKWSHFLLWNDSDSLNITVLKKSGAVLNKKIQLYETIKDSLPEWISASSSEKYKNEAPGIGYVNLGSITKNELKSAFTLFKNTKGIILDLRNYPSEMKESDLTKFLFPKNKEFVKVLFPMENQPSVGEYDGQGLLKFISDPFNTGTSNREYYKGKVVLLVNRKTQSKAEYIGMAIQQAPNCITIGEQTAGSVMNVVEYTMSDATKIYFTGLGGFYPDGKEVQKNGLRLDVALKESAKNFDPDLYIKEAIKIIESH